MAAETDRVRLRTGRWASVQDGRGVCSECGESFERSINRVVRGEHGRRQRVPVCLDCAGLDEDQRRWRRPEPAGPSLPGQGRECEGCGVLRMSTRQRVKLDPSTLRVSSRRLLCLGCGTEGGYAEEHVTRRGRDDQRRLRHGRAERVSEGGFPVLEELPVGVRAVRSYERGSALAGATMVECSHAERFQEPTGGWWGFPPREDGGFSVEGGVRFALRADVPKDWSLDYGGELVCSVCHGSESRTEAFRRPVRFLARVSARARVRALATEAFSHSSGQLPLFQEGGSG